MGLKYFYDHPIHGREKVYNRSLRDNDERINTAKYCVYYIVLYDCNGKGQNGHYIGFTSNLQKRLRDHISDARRPIYQYIHSSAAMLVHICSTHDTEAGARVAESHTIARNAGCQGPYHLINKHHNK